MILSQLRRYNQNCRVLLSTGGNLDSNKVASRRSNTTLTYVFNNSCEWLEDDSEFHNVFEFAAKVEEIAEKDSYTNKYLTALLLCKYGDRVIINHTTPGNEKIIMFNSFSYQGKRRKKRATQMRKKNLIKDEIKIMNVKNSHPSPEQLWDTLEKRNFRKMKISRKIWMFLN